MQTIGYEDTLLTAKQIVSDQKAHHDQNDPDKFIFYKKHGKHA